jgi:DnaJ-class molecular chaperone
MSNDDNYWSRGMPSTNGDWSVMCDRCDGSGKDSSGDACSRCGGSGRVDSSKSSYDDYKSSYGSESDPW